MRIRNLLAVAFCSAIGLVSAAQAQTIQVNNWPAGVPCSALNQNPDGTYQLMQDITVGSDPDTQYIMPAGNSFSVNGEYSVWAANCGS